MTENKNKSETKSCKEDQTKEKEYVQTYQKTANDDYGYYFYPNRSPGKVAEEETGLVNSFQKAGIYGLFTHNLRDNVACRKKVENCIKTSKLIFAVIILRSITHVYS